MNSPFFSIIIPTLNEEKFLPRLLESLRQQTFQDYEVILCDGNSHDKTLSIAKSYAKKLPNLIITQVENPSVSKQRNAGARLAKGKWFLFIDADGILQPYCLERLLVFIKANNTKHLTPWFSPDSNSSKDAMLTIVINGALEFSRNVKRPVAFGQFSAIEKEIFEKVQGYDEHVKWGEDNDISRRIYEAGHMIDIVRESLVIYSLRRFRKQGTIRILQLYASAGFRVILTKRSPQDIPGYIMGGHLYEDEWDDKKNQSIIKKFSQKFAKLMKELFS